MLSLLEAPSVENNGIGRVVLGRTGAICDVRAGIKSLGLKPAGADDIEPGHAKNTRHILVAIGNEVTHPKHQLPSYKGFDKNSKPVNVLVRDGALQVNVEVAVKL